MSVNSIMKKISTIQLGSHDVNFGIIQDIDTAVDAKDGIGDYEKVTQKRTELYDVANGARVAFQNKIERVEKLIIQAEAQLKELGLGKSANIENAKKKLQGDKERFKKVDAFLKKMPTF